MENIRELIKYSGFLGGSAGSGGSGGTQPDLNAAPGEPGHVLNRTHWTEIGEVELLPETVGVPYKMSGYDGFAFAGRMSNLLPGETYVVTYNGTKYTSTAFQLPESFDNMIAIGNTIAVGGANTGEPFAMIQFPEAYQVSMGVCAFIIPLDGATSVTVSISEEGEIVHKLDMKYLPTPMLVNIKNAGLPVADKTYEEVRAHYEMGGQVFIRYAYTDGTSYNFPLTHMDSETLYFTGVTYVNLAAVLHSVKMEANGSCLISDAEI